jgi:hypothetical protein
MFSCGGKGGPVPRVAPANQLGGLRGVHHARHVEAPGGGVRSRARQAEPAERRRGGVAQLHAATRAASESAPFSLQTKIPK